MKSWAIVGLVAAALVAAGCSGGDEGGSEGGSEAGGEAAQESHPRWLMGTYQTPGDVSGVDGSRHASGSSLFLRPDGTYVYEACSSSCPPEYGEWKLEGSTLRFTGYLSHGPVELSKSMSSNCRILHGISSYTLWRDEVVAGCPFSVPAPTAQECKVIGRYEKSTHFSSTTLADSTYDRITLDPDHFAATSFGTTKYQCSYDYSVCFSSYEDSEPSVGEWKVTDKGVEISGQLMDNLSQYSFTPATNCGMPKTK